MPTTYIANLALELPARYAAGDTMDELGAALLNREYIKRVSARIRYRFDHNDLNELTMQAGAYKMGLEFTFIESDADADDMDENDPVFIEGLKIAKELILRELSESGISEIPNLDMHARALYEGSEAIRDRARQRCETRWRTAKEALGIT